MLTQRDKLQLGYLAKAARPLWGGHLERGEPITDPDMRRWIDFGLIERVEDRGYFLTIKGQEALKCPAPPGGAVQ